MRLPRELRDMIYTLELYRGFIEPHAINEAGGNKVRREMSALPDLALLGVSRQVREEALSIYFGKNILVVGDNVFDQDIAEWEKWCLFISPERALHVRQLRVSFSQFMKGEVYRQYAAEYASNPGNDGPRYWEKFHLHRRAWIERTWKDKADFISRTAFNLDKLILDIEHCYCQEKCCRMVPFSRAWLQPLLGAIEYSQERLVIVGALNAEEEMFVRNTIRQIKDDSNEEHERHADVDDASPICLQSRLETLSINGTTQAS